METSLVFQWGLLSEQPPLKGNLQYCSEREKEATITATAPKQARYINTVKTN
jgi:hypothetical protein